jgi:Tfp pilus assembly protein FimT
MANAGTQRISSEQGDRGFTLLQVLVVLATIAIVTTLGFMGIATARQHVRLQNSARLLAGYLEKVRVDSVRRHASSADQMAGITFLSNTGYRVTMDFDGNGTVETRDVTLENGIIVVTNPLPAQMFFDWRGRLVSSDTVTEGISITLQYGDAGSQSSVDVTRSGDVTVDSDVYLDDVPNVNVNVGDLSGIDSGSTINGNTSATPYPSPTAEPTPVPTPVPTPYPTPQPTPVPTPVPTPFPTPSPGATATPTPVPTPVPTPIPTPVPTPTPCEVTKATSPNPFSFRKNGGSGTILFTVTTGGSVTYVSAPTNLRVTQTSSNHFTVTSLNNSRGTFTINFTSPCGGNLTVNATITN